MPWRMQVFRGSGKENYLYPKGLILEEAGVLPDGSGKYYLGSAVYVVGVMRSLSSSGGAISNICALLRK